MQRRLRSSGSPEEAAGPFQFHAISRRCPECKELLLCQERVTFGPASKIVHVLGMPCYCMACNAHYRASPRFWMRFIPWLLGLGLAGFVFAGMILFCVPCPNAGTHVASAVVLSAGMICLFRLLSLARWIWWRLVPLKKIYTYQEGVF